MKEDQAEYIEEKAVKKHDPDRDTDDKGGGWQSACFVSYLW